MDEDISVYVDDEDLSEAQAQALIAQLNVAAPGWQGAQFVKGADGEWTVNIVEADPA